MSTSVSVQRHWHSHCCSNVTFHLGIWSSPQTAFKLFHLISEVQEFPETRALSYMKPGPCLLPLKLTGKTPFNQLRELTKKTETSSTLFKYSNSASVWGFYPDVRVFILRLWNRRNTFVFPNLLRQMLPTCWWRAGLFSQKTSNKQWERLQFYWKVRTTFECLMWLCVSCRALLVLFTWCFGVFSNLLQCELDDETCWCKLLFTSLHV